MNFDAALMAARTSTERAYSAEVSRSADLDARDLAIARAWVSRPGGTTWRTLVEKINAGLPDGAKISVSTARVAEKTFRQQVAAERAVADDKAVAHSGG